MLWGSQMHTKFTEVWLPSTAKSSDNYEQNLLTEQKLTIISPVKQTKYKTRKCRTQQNEHKYKGWPDATNDPCQQQYSPQTLDTIHIQPALYSRNQTRL
jgi:hypothetical protein